MLRLRDQAVITQQKQLPTQSSVPPSRTPARVASAPAIRRRFDMGKLWQQTRKTLKGRFILLAICIVILALVQTFFLAHSFQQATNDINTIGTGSIPSVDAAQAMAQYIEDIDAKSADYLATAALTATTPCSVVGTNVDPGPQTVHTCDDLNINAEIVLANHQLFLAAHNVTYPGERTAVERITAGLEDYMAQIGIMRHEYTLAASKTDIHDTHIQNAYHAYLAANTVLTQAITTKPSTDPAQIEANLPSCTINGQSVAPTQWTLGSIRDNLDCLSNINKTHLDAAYNDTVSFLGTTIILSIVLCILFCVLVLGTTGYMVAITHRVINIGLTLAVLISITFSLAAVVLLGQASGRHGDFGQMVQDDYNSVYYAALLKKDGTNANADESRWLIAQEFSDQTEAAHWQQDWQSNTTQVHQLIQQAVANKTWPEEVQPLADIQTNWNQYYQIDGTIRSTANAGHIPDAERLSTGTSNIAFGNFSTAVDGLSTANRDHYNSTFAATQSALSLYVLLSAILFPLVGIFAVWGLSRRFKDF